MDELLLPAIGVEERVLESIRAAVDAALQASDAAHGALIDAIEGLEGLGVDARSVDKRVRVALDIVQGLGGMERPQLGIRALRAAVKHESQIADSFLRRKWLLFLGVMEIGCGRAGDAMQHLVESLELARGIGDQVGCFTAWTNLTLLSSKAGQYEDSIDFASRAIALIEQEQRREGGSHGRWLAGPLLNRGNALRRLGRLEAALSDVAGSVSLSLCDEQQSVLRTIRLTKGLALLAGCHFERGDLARGAEYLAALKRVCQMANLPAHLPRLAALVEAEADGAAGRYEKALADLESLLQQCSDGPFDVREDILYALHRIASGAGREDKAEAYLECLANGMRENAEIVISNFSRLPDAEKDVASALREVDQLMGGLVRCRSTLQRSRGAWENLVAMAASAVMLEDKSGEHGIRVAALCGRVGAALSLPDGKLRLAEEAALLHDLGKVATPAALLSKRECLTDAEAQIIAKHPDDGARLLEHSSLPNRGQIADIVRFHHQAYDGFGGRLPVRGEEIPIEARLVAVCDRFDALISGRPRSPAIPPSEAMREVLRIAGRELDPQIAAALIEVVRDISRRHSDLIGFLSEGARAYGYTSARRRLLGRGFPSS